VTTQREQRATATKWQWNALRAKGGPPRGRGPKPLLYSSWGRPTHAIFVSYLGIGAPSPSCVELTPPLPNFAMNTPHHSRRAVGGWLVNMLRGTRCKRRLFPCAATQAGILGEIFPALHFRPTPRESSPPIPSFSTYRPQTSPLWNSYRRLDALRTVFPRTVPEKTISVRPTKETGWGTPG